MQIPSSYVSAYVGTLPQTSQNQTTPTQGGTFFSENDELIISAEGEQKAFLLEPSSSSSLKDDPLGPPIGDPDKPDGGG